NTAVAVRGGEVADEFHHALHELVDILDVGGEVGRVHGARLHPLGGEDAWSFGEKVVEHSGPRGVPLALDDLGGVARGIRFVNRVEHDSAGGSLPPAFAGVASALDLAHQVVLGELTQVI